MAPFTTERKLKLGIVGIGVGASEILPQMEQVPEFELVAAADINPRVRETLYRPYGARAYDSVEKFCADPGIEAVWVSTSNRFHVAHTIPWGMATLEVCLALMQSAKERKEILLSHQVPAPEQD